MKTVLYNIRKEELVPYADASFILPFRISVSTDIGNGAYVFAMVNNDQAALRIKKIHFGISPKNIDDYSAGFLVLNRFACDDMEDGTVITPVKKRTSFDASKIIQAQTRGDHTSGITINDIENVKPLAYLPFTHSIRSHLPLTVAARNPLDTKGDIFLIANEGLGIAFSAGSMSTLLEQDEIYGFIEWDEIFN